MKETIWLYDDLYLVFDLEKEVYYKIQTKDPNSIGATFISKLEPFNRGYYGVFTNVNTQQ